MIKVLVVDSKQQDFLFVKDLLVSSITPDYHISWLSNSAMKNLAKLDFEVLLLSHQTNISESMELLAQVLAFKLSQPILYLINDYNTKIDQLALQMGADDCLSKNELSLVLLSRTIQHALHRKKTEAKLAYASTHDALTELANRYSLFQYLDHAVSLAKRSQNQFAVLYLDIDRFKPINDSLGHEVGDMLLKLVAGKLRTCIRETDIVARLGNDQFAILIENVGGSRNAAAVAEKIQQAIQSGFQIRGHQLSLTAGIGIATFPECGLSSEALLKSAELALNKAKKMGRNKYQFFTNELNRQSQLKLELERNLRRALINGEFEIYLQPQTDAVTHQIVGAEALLRWNHPEQGIISPVVFIPLLEDLAMLVGVESWVLNQVCHLAKKLTDKFGRLRFSVNISGNHFNTGNLKENIYLALQASSLDANYLEIELTEDIMIEHVEKNSNLLSELAEIGISIALDDFGKGYSSLSYLKNFPANILKIDKVFVDHLVTDHRDTAIIEAVVLLSHKLGIKVVAEGVEQKQQLECLTDIGCDYIQGYYFAKPMPVNEFEAFIANRHKANKKSKKNNVRL